MNNKQLKLYTITVSYHYGTGGGITLNLHGSPPTQKQLDDYMNTKEYKESVKKGRPFFEHINVLEYTWKEAFKKARVNYRPKHKVKGEIKFSQSSGLSEYIRNVYC